MYLLMVDYNFISTAELQALKNKIPAGSEIMHCLSEKALLEAAGKLSPEVIIVDLDLIKGDSLALFESLRSSAAGAYILALVEPGYYEKLYTSLERGTIDDYMTKRVGREDFTARLHIAAKRKSPHQNVYDEPVTRKEVSPIAFLDQENFKKVAAKSFDDDLFALTPESEDVLETGFAPDGATDTIPVEESAFLADSGSGELFRADTVAAEEQGDKGNVKYDSGIKSFQDIFNSKSEDAQEWNMPAEFADTIGTINEAPDQNLDSPVTTPQLFAEQTLDKPLAIEDYLTKRAGREDFTARLRLAANRKNLNQAGNDEPVARKENDYIAFLDLKDFKEATAKIIDYDLFERKAELEEGLEAGSVPFSAADAIPAEQNDFFTDFGSGKLSRVEAVAAEEPDDEISVEYDGGIKSIQDIFESNPEGGREWGLFSEDCTTVEKSDEVPASDFDATMATSQPFTGQYFDELFALEPEPAEHTESAALQSASEEKPAIETIAKALEEISFTDLTYGQPRSVREDKPAISFPGEITETPEIVAAPQSLSLSRDEKASYAEPFAAVTPRTEEADAQTPGQPEKKNYRSRISRVFSLFSNIFFVLLLLAVATLSFFLIQSRLAGGVPQIAGRQIYIVLSGSMSPEFDTGSIALVQSVAPEEISVGDIITFRTNVGAGALTTHRVVAINNEGGLQFVTRGDANNVDDPSPVPAANLVGRMTGSIPYLGYVLSFAQTRQGLILLIFVPGVLIIVNELGKIFKYLNQGKNTTEKSEGKKFSSSTESLGEGSR
ncbi:MAG TPA: signal peptidase I [Candidatus Limnocylindrales bacterium]|nr:signal peptidase I [Candidatus Limnocylindrales bacterium]